MQNISDEELTVIRNLHLHGRGINLTAHIPQANGGCHPFDFLRGVLAHETYEQARQRTEQDVLAYIAEGGKSCTCNNGKPLISSFPFPFGHVEHEGPARGDHEKIYSIHDAARLLGRQICGKIPHVVSTSAHRESSDDHAKLYVYISTDTLADLSKTLAQLILAIGGNDYLGYPISVRSTGAPEFATTETETITELPQPQTHPRGARHPGLLEPEK